MVRDQLPDAELEVLACLGRLGEATARSIREEMAAYRPMVHASVTTLLKRLEVKGLVAKRKGPIGKAFLFRPIQQPAHTYREVVQDLVQRVFGGSGIALVNSLFETNPPTMAEIEELENILQAHRKQLKNRRGRK
jgi:BlaI family transcriptional regulator, penicillinase repressor